MAASDARSERGSVALRGGAVALVRGVASFLIRMHMPLRMHAGVRCARRVSACLALGAAFPLMGRAHPAVPSSQSLSEMVVQDALAARVC